MKLDWNAFLRDAFAPQLQGRPPTLEEIAAAAELHLGADKDELLRETREAVKKLGRTE